jgi:alpha-beta hydrolase superfamily lysophospholipase
MEHNTGFFTGVRNKQIFHQAWLPDDRPKGVIFLVHGLGEHSGRYMTVVNRVVPLGWAVYALDHIGHGRSEGMREYVKSFSDLTGNLHRFLDMVEAWMSGVPVFLLGHSMGGLVSTAFLLERQKDFIGAVLSAPLIKPPGKVSPFLIRAGKIMSLLLPFARVTEHEIEGISRDREVIEAYKNDPLVYKGKLTARLGAELVDRMDRVLENADKITLPLLILQGSADRVVDKEGASLLFEAAGTEDKTLKIYDGYYHELFNDLDFERVLDDLSAWLEARLKKGK